MVLKPWDHQELRTDKYKRRSVCRLSFGACNIQTLEERRHTQHRTLRRSCHWHRRKFKRLGYPEGRKNQGWIYQLYQRLLGGQVRWIMEFDHWLWKHGGLQWPWHQKFWVLGPHLDISSSAFAKRHSKNQWYQNHFISSRYVFEEHPELLHSCLSSTRGRYFSHQNIKEISSFEQVTEFSIFKFLDSCFLLCIGHQLPGTCMGTRFCGPDVLLALSYFFYSHFPGSFPLFTLCILF